MNKKEYNQELKYFDVVKEIIIRKLKSLRKNKFCLKENILSERKNMWDEDRHAIIDFDDIVSLSTHNSHMSDVERQYEWNEDNIRRMSRMEDSPYFGRLDFQEKSGERVTIYIGIYSLMDNEQIYVVDWRAPISSMFYNFDIGRAWYEVNCREEVTILLKRQYKIENGKLLYMYDTNSAMHDNILGEVLSKRTDKKLKVIIGSIQKEQNVAIRKNSKKSCLISGLAGSGKTSVGLHRLAYILYNNRDTISAENILIISNNSIFSSYISNILPDLGERPVDNIIFDDLLRALLGKRNKIESYYEQLKKLENTVISKERIECIKRKYSNKMIHYIIDFFSDFPFSIPQISYKKDMVVSQALVQKRWGNRCKISYRANYEWLKNLIRNMIEDYFLLNKSSVLEDIRKNSEKLLSDREVNLLLKKTIQKYINTALNKVVELNLVNSQDILIEILRKYSKENNLNENLASNLYQSFESKKLFYEDALLYLLIKILLGEIEPYENILHVFIDESQDYSLLHFYILKYLFPKSTFTLLADVNQTVNDITTIPEYNYYEKVFGSELIKICLNISYRSSSEINALAFSIISESDKSLYDHYSYFKRSVKKPKYIIQEDVFGAIISLLKKVKKFNSIAIITDNEEEAISIDTHIRGDRELSSMVQLIISPTDKLENKYVVIPLLLAKGLEFDVVILVNLICSNHSSNLRNKLYLGCTRALHELYFVEKENMLYMIKEFVQYIEIDDFGK